jgi:hypothetical protein
MPEIHATLVKLFLAERAAPGKILGTDTTGVVKIFFCSHFILFPTPNRFVALSSSSRWLPDVSRDGCSDDLGTCCTRTGDPVTAGLVSYPLDHEVLVERIVSELPDEL